MINQKTIARIPLIQANNLAYFRLILIIFIAGVNPCPSAGED